MADQANPSWSTSVPVPRTPLIGREHERRAARDLLLADAVPLLTLIGTGGSGKTRLAQAIAGDVGAKFSDGVGWVDLAPLGDHTAVADAFAQALDLVLRSSPSVEEQLVLTLHRRQFLLLVDNCEHVLAPAADLIARLLTRCPALQVLATSRAPLHVRGEQELPVDPLPLPPSGSTPAMIADNDAVRLFVARARAAQPAFVVDESNADAVAEICRRLDGLPLAIELAAARMKVLPPAALLHQVIDRGLLLAGGPRDAPARQKTLRDTIAWSYGLLPTAQQALFRHLAVFAGGWTIEAATAVAKRDTNATLGVIDGLTTLVDHNLVRRVDSAGEPRFGMLETLCEFALERLRETGEFESICQAHAEYFLALADRAAADLIASASARAWWTHLEDEHANFQQAMAWMQAQRPGEMLRLAVSLERFWIPHGHLQQGREWLERALTANRDNLDRGPALFAAGIIAGLQGDHGQSMVWAAEGLALAEIQGGERGKLLYLLGVNAWQEARWQEAFNYGEQAVRLLREEEDLPWLAWALGDFGTAQMIAGDADRGASDTNEALALHLGLGNELGAGVLCAQLGLIAQSGNDRVAAASRFLESLRYLRREGQTWWLALPLIGAAELAWAQGMPRTAAKLLGAKERAIEIVGPISLRPEERECECQTRAAIARALGEQQFAREVAVGRTEGVNSGIAFAQAVLEAIAARLPVFDLGPSGNGAAQGFGASVDVHTLTRRERDVLALLCERLTDAEIANRLYLSRRTVETHVSRILSKLGVASRREAAALAARLTLTPSAEPFRGRASDPIP
jgi:predicted ATPase/DNA-binding CsgD family transcriptional regulator